MKTRGSRAMREKSPNEWEVTPYSLKACAIIRAKEIVEAELVVM